MPYTFEELNKLSDLSLQEIASAVEVILMNRMFMKNTEVTELDVEVIENENF